MVSEKDVIHWQQGDTYKSLLEFVEKKLSLPVSHEPVPDILYSFNAEDMNLAGVNIDDLEEIAKNKELCASFVSEKLKVIAGTEHEQEGKDEEDEEDEIIEELDFYSNFLSGYLLELYFLMVKPDSLEAYLKAIRMPHSKKYAVQLRSVLEKIS